MAKEIGTTGILLLLLLSLVFLSQMDTQTTLVNIGLSGGKINSSEMLNATVKNANKWFNSYPSGQYSFLLIYGDKQLRLSNIDANVVTFYLDDSPDCVDVHMYRSSKLVDTRRVCK